MAIHVNRLTPHCIGKWCWNSRVHEPTQEDAENERSTEGSDTSRQGVDVGPHEPARTSEDWLAAVLAAVHEHPTTVPRNVHDGVESTLPVEVPIGTFTPGLRAALTTCTPMVYLIFFDVHPVWTKLGGKGNWIVRKPLVP